MDLPRDVFSDFEPWRETFRQTSPIIMYHKLGRRALRQKFKGITLPMELFRRQLAAMQAAGVAFASLDEPLELNRAVLTFDDGSATVFCEGLDTLREFSVPSCMYIVANQIGGFNEWDVREHGEMRDTMMDTAQIRDWLVAGQQIGSHTLNHVRLPLVSIEEMRTEIFDSKKKLEDLFQVPIRHFCYPYGFYDRRTVEMVAEAGYQTATLVEGGIATPASKPLVLPRLTARRPSRNFRDFFRSLVGLPPKRKNKTPYQ